MKKTIKKTMSMAVAMMMVVGVLVSATLGRFEEQSTCQRW